MFLMAGTRNVALRAGRSLGRYARHSSQSMVTREAESVYGTGYVMTRSLPDGLGELYLAAAEPLCNTLPGNGGLRLWHYDSADKAEAEAIGLGRGMAIKHDTFNTGFAGAKLVCAANKPPSTWSAEQKTTLLDETALMLKDLQGKMYTGCDMNTTTQDMDYLSKKTLYVLAAIGNRSCCPNTATAYGVFGAVEAALGGDVEGKRLLVHGCGGVGSVVARLLVEHGAASVHTVDTMPERADVEGCVNVSDQQNWWEGDVDAIVPCSSSGLLKDGMALGASTVVGSTNLPFASKSAQEAAESKLAFVPEGVSSAGAVIVDSIEHYSPEHFGSAEPELLYEFTREVVRAKTLELLDYARSNDIAPSKVVADIAEDRATDPIGRRFGAWLELRSRDNSPFTVSGARL